MSEDEGYSADVAPVDLRERIRGTPVEELFDLAELDGEAARLELEMRKNLEEIRHLEAGLALIKKELENRQHALKELQRVVGREEGEVAELTARRKQLDGRMMRVTNAKELQAMQEELGKLTGEIGQREEKLLELYEKLELATKETAEEAARIDEAARALDKKTAKRRTRNAAAALEVTRLREKRGMHLARLEPELCARYERAFEKHGGVVVFAIDENACGGCGWSAPASELHRLRQNPGKPFDCANCYRLNVWVGAHGD